MLDGVIVPVQQALFSILYFLSVIFWGLNQALLLVGYYILTITSWLSESMFQPLLESVGNATDSLLLPIFTLAMLTLAITYMLGVFGVFRVVEFRSAVMWMLVAIMWFQFGPEIYLGFEQTRRELGGAFFATTFTDLTSGSASIEGLGDVGDAGDLNINPPVNNFGAFLSFDTAIDGLDIALAYLNADGCDVLRTTGCITFLMPDGSDGALPTLWYTADDYFDLTQHGFLYPSLTNEQRQASLDDAAAGIWRALSGMVVSLFGMLEQIVQLLLTIAFGIGFASFFIAVLFAFFKKTESVTWAVFDVILGLFIQSIITSLLLALVMAFVSVAGATGNGILLLGVGFIGIILVTVLLLGAVSAILKALNGLMGSFGSVTGGNLAAAGSVSQLASAYATGGATLLGGGSIAQAAGSALGPGAGQKAYYAAQTFGSDSRLGGIAQQVAQGSVASYLGPVGGYALGRSNRNADDEADESASNKRTVSDLTLGTPIRSHDEGAYIDTPNLNQRATQGADGRVDPLTQQTYEFDSQDNGMGLRTYEDGSRLRTSADDEPQNQERARDEQQALRQQADDGNGGLNQDAINRIDASDDDESAVLNSSIARLSAMMGATNAASGAGADQSNDTIQVLASLTDLPTGDSETKKSASTDPTSVQATATESLTADQLSTEMFLADVERAYPGSTGHPELVQKYFPENEPTSATSESVQPIPTQSASPATSDSASNRLANYADDGVQSIRSIGPATAEQLATINITSAGQLANADPNHLASLEKITPSRANQLVQSAQAYVARPDPDGSPPATQSVSTLAQTMSPVSVANSQANLSSSSPSANQIASAVDASNNDDGARLATRMSAAITSASNTGRIPSRQQASQIARESGLPPIRESGQFVQIASAMNLSPQQAQAVIQDVQTTGQMNPEIATSVRSSLSALTLPTTGKPLDQAGMSSAINNLERAAQALVGAADRLNGAGASNSSTEDQINAGANSSPRSSSSSES